ncbi:MAG TPA: hypothetical protein VJJ21_05065 [Candidatus Nanoarchaeia archaeon]|nr:hypothetical protein [Candidatus Nanoarchaeia archaeon]
MTGKHIELELYFASCDSGGLVEGMLYLNENEYINRRRQRAIDRIKQELANAIDERTTYTSIQYIFDPRNFVSDEKEARTLIEFLERELKGSGIIEPESCMHGKLKFFRKIIFDGLLLEDIERIRESIKESGLHLTSEGDIRHIDDNRILHQYTKLKPV